MCPRARVGHSDRYLKTTWCLKAACLRYVCKSITFYLRVVSVFVSLIAQVFISRTELVLDKAEHVERERERELIGSSFYFSAFMSVCVCRMKDTSKKNNIFAQFRKNDRDRQKLIETVVRQLRALVTGMSQHV